MPKIGIPIFNWVVASNQYFSRFKKNLFTKMLTDYNYYDFQRHCLVAQ